MRELEFKGFRADRLKEAIEENGVTDADIAEIIAGAGYHAKIEYIKDILTERISFVPLHVLYLICKAANVSADYLLGLSDDMY